MSSIYPLRKTIIWWPWSVHITERKKAEEALQKSEKKYKDLFDSTLDGIYQIDADGVFILMNPAGVKMFGCESPAEIIGTKALEFWRNPLDRDIFREELKIKKSVSNYHMKLKKKNGDPIELETSSTIREDEKGAFLGMEGILRDVTERQKLENPASPGPEDGGSRPACRRHCP